MLRNTKEEQPNTTLIIISAACIYIFMGLLLLLIPKIQLITIAYVLSAASIVMGIALIVKYFLAEAYRNMNQYGFSVGSLFVILGVCAMVKAEVVSQYFLLCMGILLLVSAIVKLQNALDLKALDYRIWNVFLGIAVLILICAVTVIMNPFAETGDLEHFTYIILIADGTLSLISTLCLSFQVRKYQERMLEFENSMIKTDFVAEDTEPETEQSETETMEEKENNEEI